MDPVEEFVVVDPASLAECCARLRETTCLGFDTEFVGEDTYEPSLCLIQISTPTFLCLIDPLSAGPLDDFWKLLVDPARTVIVHAGREEIRMCRRWSGVAPTNWFDLQVAAGLVGLAYPLGHGALVYQLLGQRLTKAETLTEWRHRPLSSAQVSYAFDDVRYLLPLWQQLDGQLHALGRRVWAQQEFARFTAMALPGTANQSTAPDKWRKLRGVGALDRRRMAMVREMYLAREAIAAEMNRPPRVLVRDDLLIEIARRNPKTPNDVQVVRGLAKRFVTPLWDAIERARKLTPDQLPPAIEREQDPPQVALIVNLLTAILNDFCAREKLAVALTATMSDLKDLVRAKMQKEEPSPTNLLMTGWRREFVLPAILDVLEGRRSVRIADLEAESPFKLES
ncbi:MAG TPA: HRDC domain-containing protein [Gemmataceae bacterium]|nr:HRDC domain-containing protein [Gemmataceae bacterium]